MWYEWSTRKIDQHDEQIELHFIFSFNINMSTVPEIGVRDRVLIVYMIGIFCSISRQEKYIKIEIDMLTVDSCFCIELA